MRQAFSPDGFRLGQEAAWPAAVAAVGRVLPLALAGLAATTFSVLYVRSEQPIYAWDWVGYFVRFQDYGARFSAGGADWLAQLFGSLRYDDYNVVVLTPMLASYILFGDSRTVFVVSIVLLYLFPAALIAVRLAARAGGFVAPSAWLVAAALLYWPLWLAALRGMPDIAGLIPLGGATLLVLRTRFLSRASITAGIALGIMVWLAFVTRRWYAYACVAIMATTFLFAAWTAFRERGVAVPRAASAFLASVLTIVATLLVFQAPLVFRILHTSYGDIYDAYQKPLAETAAELLGLSGLVMLVPIAAGLLRAARACNADIGFMGAAAALTAFLFLRTQALGIQHILPIAFWLFPAFVYGATWPIDAMRAAIAWRQTLAPVMLAGCLSVFVPATHRMLAFAGALLPTQAYPPLVLNDRAGYDAMVAGLANVMRDPEDKVAVFASSQALSGSLLASFDPSHAGSLVPVSDVDKRDGLRLGAFAARFAIATQTPALHLDPSKQRVLSIPDRMIVEGTGPGAAYHKVAGPYALDGGLSASIYRRDRPWSAADAEAVAKAIAVFYPDWTMKDGRLR